jgi:hypothetical protein
VKARSKAFVFAVFDELSLVKFPLKRTRLVKFIPLGVEYAPSVGERFAFPRLGFGLGFFAAVRVSFVLHFYNRFSPDRFARG